MMKMFNKMTALLIIASFMFCGDVFAVGQDDSKRVAVRAKRAQLAKERAKTRVAARKKNSRAEQAAAKKAVASRQRRASQKQVPAVNKRNTRRTARVNAQTPTQQVQPKAVTRRKSAKASPQAPSRKAAAKAPRYYTIKTNELPADLQKDVKLFALKKGERLKSQYKAKPEEIREVLNEMQMIENHAPGITQRTRSYLVANGYNPANSNDVAIFTHNLPEELHYYVSTFVLEEGEDLAPVYILSQAKLTKMLSKLQEREGRAAGATQRAREFLKNKYGFQG